MKSVYETVYETMYEAIGEHLFKFTITLIKDKTIDGAFVTNSAFINIFCLAYTVFHVFG